MVVFGLAAACAGAQTVSVSPAGSPGQARQTGAVQQGTISLSPHRAVANGSTPMAATPQFSVAAGHYAGAQSVAITDATEGATIYYTTDGSTPWTGSTGYAGPVSITQTETLVAIAVAPGYAQSDYAIATYYIGSAPASYVYTIAGTDFWGYAGDGGPAAQAVLNYPDGVAIDDAGNVYIADTTNSLIRRIDASTGNISTIAGTGARGFSGDGGKAVNAQLSYPYGLAFDSAGALYVSDTDNYVVRRIDLGTGTISTYAGNPNAASLGDGGPATSAQIFNPLGIAFDRNNNLYICSSNRIRKVDGNTKTISTVAGNGNWGHTGDNGPAVNATMQNPAGVAVDSAGNIYIADELNQAIRKVNQTTGIITTYAGTLENGGYGGDGGAATAAKLWYPQGVAVDSSGNLYIADFLNFRIRKVTAATGVISTVVGNNYTCFSFNNDGSPATGGAMCAVTGINFDHKGNLYMAVGSMSRVKMMTVAGPPPTQFTATPVLGLPSGTYATPQSLTITDSTPGAAIYVSTGGYNPPTGIEGYHGPITIGATLTVKAVAIAPGYMPSAVAEATYTVTAPPRALVSTVAGNGTTGFSGSGGPARSASLRTPAGLAIDIFGNGYIADSGNHVVWRVDSGTGNIKVFAGTGTQGPSGDGGPATVAQLSYPYGVSVDRAGNVYIADANNNRIREVTIADGKIKTVAGNGTNGYTGPYGPVGDGGPATSAGISFPKGVAFDAQGNFYIADSANRVREVNISTGIIETVAGNPGGPPATDGALATSVSINGPNGVFVDLSGNVYFSEQYNGRIWKVDAKTGLLHAAAGNGTNGTTGDGSPATEAQIEPQAFTLDRAGNIYISEFDKLRRVDGKTGVISRAAGIDFGGLRDDNVPASVAGLCPGYGITLDAADRVYFSDGCAAGVRQIKFTMPAAPPEFSLAAGTYLGNQTLSLGETTPETTIYYTTDGTSPTAASPVYSGPITLTVSTTITAAAVAPGFAPSTIVSAHYNILPRKVTCCQPITPGGPAH